MTNGEGIGTSNGAADSTGPGLTPLPPAPRSPRLDNAIRVRIEVARVYRRAAAGLIDWQTATRATSVLFTIHRMLDTAELSDLAERVAALEARP